LTEGAPPPSVVPSAGEGSGRREGNRTRSTNVLCGVYAALPTPLGDDGEPDVSSLDALIEFLLGDGVSGFCVGGVTGEYPIYSVAGRDRLFRHVAQRTAGRVPLVFGIGAEHSRQALGMAKVAKDLGAIAVLLPPPSYFRFDPLDVPEMMRQVSESLPLPVVLYHIPQFTNNLGASDALALVRSVENIVGVKDSSGDRLTLEQFAAAKRSADVVLMAGSDDLFLSALALNADGAISGLSCIFPKLMLGIYDAFRKGAKQRAAELQALVQELAAAVNELPTPWGIKIALEVQGFHMGSLSWPCGSRLAARTVRFRKWFENWALLVRQRLSDSPSVAGKDGFKSEGRYGQT